MNFAKSSPAELWTLYKRRFSADGDMEPPEYFVLDKLIETEMHRDHPDPAGTVGEALSRIAKTSDAVAAYLDPNHKPKPITKTKARPPKMATKAEKIAKHGATAVALIADAASKLMAEDPTLTVEKARVMARRNLPSVVKQAERAAGPTSGNYEQAPVQKTHVETIGDRIEKAVSARAEWLSCQPGSRDGVAFSDMRFPALRNAVRHSPQYQKIRELARGPLAKQAADTIKKSGEHAEAHATIDRWLAL